ncbi:FliM/FliN family flagellar motor switch protein [Pinirhizobacter sp.]|jgi:flagellar motor switch/type III secretory pathway protein FliN|uniref:FliM/FliN family flagellar motor switch protein n=1 Tax=Pinirhizobacter sp. TaxID=2950432 RepID=UPI002F3F227B
MSMPGRRFACLRAADKDAARIAEVTTRWRRAGHVPDWQTTTIGRTYLRFSAHGQDQATCLIDAQAWAQARMPPLAHIGWGSVTTDMAERLVADIPDPLRLSMPRGMPAPEARWAGVFRPDVAEHLPVIPSSEGDALIHGRWQWPIATGGQLISWRGSVAIEFHLGHTRLKPPVISRLGVGDVLLLQTQRSLATTGLHTLFTFSLGQEGLIVDEFINRAVEADYLDGDTTVTDTSVDLNRVPLRVDVVLAQRSCSLDELAGWASGSVIPLDSAAWTSVQLRIHGQLLATGELVQAGDGLAIQISQMAAP